MARQYAGMTCVSCSQKITAQTEGTYCVSCENVFHIDCVTAAQGICPACRAKWLDPTEFYTWFHLCPLCGYRTTQNMESCRCGNRLYTDSDGDFETYYKRISSCKRTHFLFGITAFVLGVGFFALFILANLDGRWKFIPDPASLIPAAGLIVGSIPQLMKYKRESRFCRIYSK